MRIFVLPSGWVIVGKMENGLLNNGNIIRVWGTTQGIGELKDGPLEKTELDPLPDGVQINDFLFSIPVKGKWYE